MTKKQREMDIAENLLYHDTWKLLKKYRDVVWSLLDDSGLLCEAYNTTELGEKDCTRIYVMEKGRFGKWLSEREKHIRFLTVFVPVFPDT